MEYKELSSEELELLNLEQEESEESIGIQRYAFNAFRIERSIRDILSWVNKGKIIIPEFQRDFVWNYNQCSKFIESILLGLPIPDFFMFRLIDSKEHNEKYILIDGLQRYTTIKQFVDGTYAQDDTTRTFKINNKNSQWYGKTYEKLDEVDKDFLKDYSLKINVFDSVEDSEKIQKLYMTEIFERINTGATKLSGQEVRNAIYAGPAISAIKSYAKQEDFLNLLHDDKKKYLQRCKNEEFFLRLLTYNHIYRQLKNGSTFFVAEDKNSKITSSKDVMLCEYLFNCNKEIIDYNKNAEQIIEAISQIYIFNDTAFCTVKREIDEVSSRVHEVFSEALVIALLDGAAINISPTEFDNQKIKIWRDQETYVEFFHSTTDLGNVKKRIETMKKLLTGEL